MSAAFAQKISVRLFIQAAFTGLLAMSSARGSTWLLLTFAVAAGAAGVGAVIRSNQANARQLVVGFEAVAVAVGAIGLAGGHYIPGTIVGIATLITVLGTRQSVAAPGTAVSAGPDAPVPAFATPDNVYAPPPARALVAPQPSGAAVEAAPAAAPTLTPATPTPPVEFAPAPRAMTILPGQ